MKNFENWWSSQYQTIGRVAARSAWDYQQIKIIDLEKQMQRNRELAAHTIGSLQKQVSTLDIQIVNLHKDKL